MKEKSSSRVVMISAFKLKRTDTTLDLSQKAKRAGEGKERKILEVGERGRYIYSSGSGRRNLRACEWLPRGHWCLIG
jgi:hypothetical protein